MLNILITGANGQLGNELRERKMISNNPFHFIYTDADTLDITFDVTQSEMPTGRSSRASIAYGRHAAGKLASQPGRAVSAGKPEVPGASWRGGRVITTRYN